MDRYCPYYYEKEKLAFQLKSFVALFQSAGEADTLKPQWMFYN